MGECTVAVDEVSDAEPDLLRASVALMASIPPSYNTGVVTSWQGGVETVFSR